MRVKQPCTKDVAVKQVLEGHREIVYHKSGDPLETITFRRSWPLIRILLLRLYRSFSGAIMGYGDYVISDSVISRVYYVEGLGHNFFFVGQFCDSDLEVAFRKHTCFVRDLEGVDLIKGIRGMNLYTISVEDMMRLYEAVGFTTRRRLRELLSRNALLIEAIALSVDSNFGTMLIFSTVLVLWAEALRDPLPNLLRLVPISSGLVPNYAPAILYAPPTNKDLELLFQPMFDEYFKTPTGDHQMPHVPAAPTLAIRTVLSKVEPKNFKSVVAEDCWFQAMQDESESILNSFSPRLDLDMKSMKPETLNVSGLIGMNIMADVNAPIEQAPAVAPPTRTDEQILPRIRWVPIGKSNYYLDAEKSQSNPIYKIAVDILKHT
ncbi:hypothetical protein Tco_1182094, partial [Tanacetum coccineum]